MSIIFNSEPKFLVLFLFYFLTEGIESNSQTEIEFQTNKKLDENQNAFGFQTDIRLAINDINRKWLSPNIPFIISDKFSTQNKALIERAFHAFQNTCIKFEARKENDMDYIFIREGEGCNSPVGRQGGPQNVTLGEGCLQYNTIIHELMHSIGFFHEHQRYDRDDHILIHRQNIKRGMEFEFTIRPKSETVDTDFKYDYNSVMQYEETAFSRNGRPTAKVQTIKLGPINGLSPTDIRRINHFYGCDRQNSLPNEEIVNTFNPNLSCLDLKWKSFDQNSGQNLMVFGGKDSFGNRFYICRTSLDFQLMAGHMFDGICYVLKNGREVQTKEFQVLTHSKNGYKWQLLSSNRLPPNSVITGKGLTSEGNKVHSIGTCFLKYLDYRCRVVGSIQLNGQSERQLSVSFNGIEIKCNKFDVLLCRTSKSSKN